MTRIWTNRNRPIRTDLTPGSATRNARARPAQLTSNQANTFHAPIEPSIGSGRKTTFRSMTRGRQSADQRQRVLKFSHVQ